jgi:hypothetical protein
VATVIGVGTIKSPVAASNAATRMTSAATETTVARRPESAARANVAAVLVRAAAAAAPVAERTECAATTGALGGPRLEAALVLMPDPSSKLRLVMAAETGARMSRGVR